MAIRFKRTKSFCNGLVKVNINKKSISVSIGVPGFGATITGKDVHYHLGLPGTGLSYTNKVRLIDARRNLGTII